MNIINGFRNIFKTRNEFEKCLQKSKLFNNNFEILDPNVFDLIKLFLEGKGEGIASEQALKIFFTKIEECDMTWNIKIKVLTTIHKLILEIGTQFADDMLNYKLNSIKQTKKNNKKHVLFHHIDMVQWVEENIINFYYNYLQKLAINYQIYRICIEDGELPSSDDFKLDYKLKFMWLFKISNIFNYIVKIQRSLKIVFSEFDTQTTVIIKEVGLLILHDLVAMYDVMSKEIIILVDRLQLLTTTDAIQFHEMYKELQIVGEQLQEFVKLKHHFDSTDLIKMPDWFKITNEQKKEIENYNKKIQLLFHSAVRIKREIRLQTEEEQFLQQQAINNMNGQNEMYQDPDKPKTPPPIQSTFSFNKQIRQSNNQRSKSAFQGGEEQKIQPFYYNDEVEDNQENKNEKIQEEDEGGFAEESPDNKQQNQNVNDDINKVENEVNNQQQQNQMQNMNQNEQQIDYKQNEQPQIQSDQQQDQIVQQQDALSQNIEQLNNRKEQNSQQDQQLQQNQQEIANQQNQQLINNQGSNQQKNEKENDLQQIE